MGLEAARLLSEGTAMDRVKRWDVYDIADELADVPGMLQEAIDDERVIPEIRAKIADLEKRLWAASERGGSVGPYPHYEETAP